MRNRNRKRVLEPTAGLLGERRGPVDAPPQRKAQATGVLRATRLRRERAVFDQPAIVRDERRDDWSVTDRRPLAAVAGEDDSHRRRAGRSRHKD
jgi:hypothetical protein